MRETPPQGIYKVQALDRAFAVLDLLAESDTRWAWRRLPRRCSCIRAPRTVF